MGMWLSLMGKIALTLIIARDGMASVGDAIVEIGAFAGHMTKIVMENGLLILKLIK